MGGTCKVPFGEKLAMRRFWVFALLLFLTTGCGVSKSKYNDLMSEKERLNDQLTMMTTEKNKLQGENEKLAKELSDARTSLENTLGEKQALRQEYDRLVDEKISLKNDHDRLLREKQVLESRVFELEKKGQPKTP